MASSRLRHQVERTRNKHSRAVIVDGTVVIRLAKNLSKREEERHIDYLLKRMSVIVAREAEKTVVHPFRRLLEGHSLEAVRLGDGREFTIALKPAARTRVRAGDAAWTVDVGPKLRMSPFHRLLWRTLSRRELPRLEALVRNINDRTLRVPISSVRVGFASSQWGSCSTRGVIMLNAALLFLPDRLLEYVVIHELAHRLEQGHDGRFWSVVEAACPDYRERVAELKRYRLPKA
jgi:predicted metal-dependent hydrolase